MPRRNNAWTACATILRVLFRRGVPPSRIMVPRAYFHQSPPTSISRNHRRLCSPHPPWSCLRPPWRRGFPDEGQGAHGVAGWAPEDAGCTGEGK